MLNIRETFPALPIGIKNGIAARVGDPVSPLLMVFTLSRAQANQRLMQVHKYCWMGIFSMLNYGVGK